MFCVNLVGARIECVDLTLVSFRFQNVGLHFGLGVGEVRDQQHCQAQYQCEDVVWLHDLPVSVCDGTDDPEIACSN